MSSSTPARFRSSIQKKMTLSVTEAELYAAFMTTQQMMYVLHVSELIGLRLIAHQVVI